MGLRRNGVSGWSRHNSGTHGSVNAAPWETLRSGPGGARRGSGKPGPVTEGLVCDTKQPGGCWEALASLRIVLLLERKHNEAAGVGTR